MDGDKLDMPNRDERYETMSVEVNDDSVKFIENYITLHPEFGYKTVEQYLKG